MIVGRSGGGKSLTLRALMGLLPVTAWRVSGDIVFEDKRFDASRPKNLAGRRGAGMAMIFQDPAAHLDPLMTVGVILPR